MSALLSNNVIYAGAGHDRMSGRYGDDTIYGEDGDDYLIGDNGNDVLFGGNGDDLIRGQNDSDILRGGDGNDTLEGGDANDLLEGGAGSDLIYGGLAEDTYVFGRGDGRETHIEGNGQYDRIVLGAGISLSDLTFELVGLDLYIALNQADTSVPISQFSDNIRIVSWASHYTYQIEKLQFADGSAFALPDYQYLRGTTAGDTIYGAGPKGWFDGGDGNDTIYGYSQAAGRNSSVSVQQHFRGGNGQ